MKLIIVRDGKESVELEGVTEITVLREPGDLPEDEHGTNSWANISVFVDGEISIEAGSAA